MNYKFTIEFELKISPKVIFPYLSTPIGFEKWFADKVTVRSDIWDFVWDNDSHFAEMVINKANKMVRFEFKEEAAKSSYIEFRLENSEITGTTFMKITDFSYNSDEKELTHLWTNLINLLKEATAS